jgi:hypothetical protein
MMVGLISLPASVLANTPENNYNILVVFYIDIAIFVSVIVFYCIAQTYN